MIYIILFTLIFLLILFILFKQKKKNPYIVISLTTSPTRINKLQPIINNMLSQSIIPNQIILNIPYIFKRTNEKYNIPSFLNQSFITINRVEDIGPITKILPTFKLKLPNNSLIISIDDDIIYGNNMIETIVYYHKKFPNYIFSGKSFVENYMIAGFSAVAYPYNIMKNIDIDLNIPNVCKFSDDFVISNYILNNNIKIRMLYNLYTIIPLEYGLQSDALHKGGVINEDKIQIDENADVHLTNYKHCAKYYYDKKELNEKLYMWLN
jgi:hypothetical protein